MLCSDVPQAVVVFRRAVALKATRGPSYRTIQQAIENADTYAGAVVALERAVAHNELGVALDFAPTADYARRFANTTALYLASRPSTLVLPGDRALAERAVRAIAALLLGVPPRGRRALENPSDEIRSKVAARYSRWRDVVTDAWESDDFVVVVIGAGGNAITWSRAHRRELARLRRRPKIRPSAIAAQLTAWELDMPVRRVRAARANIEREIITR